jgi:hypothetical protein
MPRLLITILALILTTPALAQLPSARLNSIFPCGARQGTTVDCTINGADLDGTTALYFSRPGLKAKSIGPNKFTVSVAADVPPGQYDVRAVATSGLSNFRAFLVSDWPEAIETEPNDVPEKAQHVNIPAIVNGRIDKATDVDLYTFSAKKGQRLLIECWAQRIDSPLDGTIAILDARGKELDYSGDDSGRDPLLDFTAPADGDYVVKIWDFVYAGGSDYVYRLQIGTAPHLDAVVPASIRPGETATITLLGRNLPGGKPANGPTLARGGPLEAITRDISAPAAATLSAGEAIRPPQASLDGFAFRLSTPSGSSNPIFLGIADDPVIVEREPNNAKMQPQVVPFPSEVSGGFDRPGDMDFYAFDLKKGDKVVVEAIGERQSGFVDPFLAGFDATGRRVFSGDDTGGRNVGQLRFTTTTRDPRWEFTAGADGRQLVQIRDLYFQQRGEARYRYRLSLRRPRPDFRLFAVPTHDVQPDATTIGRGGRNWLDVLAVRNDGFDGPIAVEASGLPAGVSCDPVVIGPGMSTAPLVFRAERDAPLGHTDLTITGKARIDGRDVAHPARGGGLTWPTVNTPGIARMAGSIPLAVRESPPFVVSARPVATEVAPGAMLSIPIEVERGADWSGAIQLSGFDMPQGATVALVNVASGAKTAKVEVKLPANLRPGEYTFTINGAGQVPRDYLIKRDPKERKGNNVRAIFPSNPITIRVGAR